MAGEIKSGADALVVDEKDDVATLIRDAAAGESVHYWFNGQLQAITLNGDIQFGHKVALRMIQSGDTVKKYGEVIGRATEDIVAGSHVHVHNLEGIRGRGDQHQG
ncbi:UxaA family hydrolase [Paenibacillus marinisediminis]